MPSEAKRNVRRIWVPVLLLVLFVGALAALRRYSEIRQERDNELPPQRVDLMALIELRNDMVRGGWKMDGGALLSPSEVDALLQIPYAPPLEYDVEAIIEWREGDDGFGIGLASGSAQMLAAMDSHGHSISGLAQIDGKPVDENETTFRGRVFEKDRPVKVLCAVRLDSVTVKANGSTLIEWKADFRRVSLRSPWEVRSRESLFLCSLHGVYRITSLSVMPITRAGRLLR
jgi:hypothetical protein